MPLRPYTFTIPVSNEECRIKNPLEYEASFGKVIATITKYGEPHTHVVMLYSMNMNKDEIVLLKPDEIIT